MVNLEGIKSTSELHSVFLLGEALLPRSRPALVSCLPTLGFSISHLAVDLKLYTTSELEFLEIKETFSSRCHSSFLISSVCFESDSERRVLFLEPHPDPNSSIRRGEEERLSEGR